MDAGTPIRWSLKTPSAPVPCFSSLSGFSPERGHLPHRERLGCCQGWDPNPRAPLLLGTSLHGDPAGIERGTWTVQLAASRGHCLRPRGSIRRALGVKHHFQSRPGHRGGGGSKIEVAQGGLLGMGGPAVGGSWGCPSGGNPPRLTLGLGSPETAAGGRGGRGGRLDLTAPLLLHPRSQEWEQTWGSWKIPETSVARRQGGVNVSKKAWAVLGWSPH